MDVPWKYWQVRYDFEAAVDKKGFTLLWKRSLSYRNQSIDLFCISVDWFHYNSDLRHEEINFDRNFSQCVKVLDIFQSAYLLTISISARNLSLSECSSLSLLVTFEATFETKIVAVSTRTITESTWLGK